MTNVRIGDWEFSVKQVDAIRVDVYGKPYTARISFSTINGQCQVYGMIAKTEHPVTESDFESLEEYIFTHLGYNEYYRERFNKHGVVRLQKINLLTKRAKNG